MRFFTKSLLARSTFATLAVSCGAFILAAGCGGSGGGDDNAPERQFVIGEWRPESFSYTGEEFVDCSDPDLPTWASVECRASRFNIRLDGTYERVSFDRLESGTWRLERDDVLVTRDNVNGTERREQVTEGSGGEMVLQIGSGDSTDTVVWERR